MAGTSVIRPVLEAGLNRIKLATFSKHGEEAREATRRILHSAAKGLAERHYRLEDELPHVASFVGGSLRYPYSMKPEGNARQFTPNFYRASGVLEVVASDFMLKHAFGADSQPEVEKTAQLRHAAQRFMNDFYATGELSEKAVKELEESLGSRRVRQLQQRMPEAEARLEAVLKKFLAGAKPLGKAEQVRRMRLVERLRNSIAYAALPFVLLGLKR